MKNNSYNKIELLNTCISKVLNRQIKILLHEEFKKILDYLEHGEANIYSIEYIASAYIGYLKEFLNKEVFTKRGNVRTSRSKNRDIKKCLDELKRADSTIKRIIAEEIAKSYKRRSLQLNNYSSLIDEIKNALCSLGYDVRVVDITLKYRGNVGVSSGFGRLLFEWGISFDPYLNVPYIPASTVKGAVRSMFIQMCIKEKENENLCEKKADKIFGSTDAGAGLIMFTDAYPISAGLNGYLLIPDVTTPHYNDDKIKYEIDVIPKPIVHLAINRGVKFRFLIYVVEKRGKRSLDYEEDLARETEKATSTMDLRLFDKALLLSLGLGLGAKTNTGYTHFYINEYKKETCSNR